MLNLKFLMKRRFFMNGYITVGYEFGSELTYPHAETSSSGLLNAAGELCGVGKWHNLPRNESPGIGPSTPVYKLNSAILKV